MLTDYKNDFFATHNDMGAALAYVNDLCAAASNSADSIAIRTAAHIILNTAIRHHQEEKNVLVDKINEMSKRANPVTALMSLVREQVREAIAEQDVSEKIDTWMADNLSEAIDGHIPSRSDIKDLVNEQIENWMADNLDQKLQDWQNENVDIDLAVEEYMEKQSIMGDLISEKIGNFFGNNTFTIEPR